MKKKIRSLFLFRLYFDKRWSGQGKDGGGPGVERGGGAPADNGGRTPRPAAGAGALPGTLGLLWNWDALVIL